MADEHEEGSEDSLREGLGDAFEKIDKGASTATADEDEGAEDEQDERAGEAEAEDADDEEGEEDAGDDADADEGEESDEGDDDTEADDEEEDGAAADADDDEGEEDEAEEGEEEQAATDELDDAFADAADRHRLPTSFERVLAKVPKAARAEARAALQGRLAQMESGYTRAMQEARAERRELVKLRKEKKYNDDNRVDVIAEALQDDKLFDAVNAELEKRGNAAYSDAKKMRTEDARKKLDEEAEQESAAVDRQSSRADAIERIARRYCRDEGIPYELGVEKALYIHLINTNADPLKRDLSDREIKRIVQGEAKTYRKVAGVRRQKDRKEYVREKLRERDEGRKRVTSRDRGHAPAPGKRKEPASLKDALSSAAARVAPDMPAG